MISSNESFLWQHLITKYMLGNLSSIWPSKVDNYANIYNQNKMPRMKSEECHFCIF